MFPYQVSEAAFLNGPDRTLFLFLLETTAAGLRVLQLSRAEGFRGQEVRNSSLVKLSISAQFQVQWSRAPNLTLGPGPSTQALNCAQSKWQVVNFFPSIYQLSVRWHPMDAILKPDI